jgi:hypothetical protein
MSAAALTRQRCWTHSAREAAARCPACERFFCRECVTEHDGRLLCAACLRALLVAAKPSGRRTRRALAVVWQALQVGAALALIWFFFYLCAQTLISLPSKFHEGTVWSESFLGG